MQGSMSVQEYSLLLGFVGIMFIIVGLSTRNERFMRWQINWQNRWEGVATNITEGTVKAWKVGGLVAASIGIVVLVLGIVLYFI
jgi:hypothetical protein